MSMVREGKKVLVDEFTTPSPVVVKRDTPIDEVMEIMGFHGFRHMPVVGDDGTPVGLISDRDLKVITNFGDIESFRAKDMMTPEPYVVTANTPLEEVALVMSKYKWGSAIVVYPEDGGLGIFTSTDALNALIELLRGGVESGVTEASASL